MSDEDASERRWRALQSLPDPSDPERPIPDWVAAEIRAMEAEEREHELEMEFLEGEGWDA